MKVLSLLILAVFVVFCYGQPPQQATEQQKSNDINTLNYALTLEHLEAAFYTQGLERFSDADFAAANYSSMVRSYINLIRTHEVSHVNLLTTVLNSQGALAVRACTYNFTAALSSLSNFIATARVLEATGTAAYDGAANTINDATYLQVAATIATVEARHTAFLSELNNASPFPDNFEPTLTPEQVIAAAAGFFVSCPDNTDFPYFAYNYVPLSYNRTYLNESGQLETSEQFQNDNDVLNYALTAELLGQAFYSNAASFTQQNFTDAGYGDAYPYFQMIIQHEMAHVMFLQQALAARGAQAAQPCSYNVGNALDSVENALTFARMLENLEVTAYDGAINRLTQYDVIQAAATIATVEARHAQYLNNLLLMRPVNNESLDMAYSPAMILNMTAGLFGANCQAPVIPVPAYTLQEFGTNAYVQQPPAPTPSPMPMPSPSTGGNGGNNGGSCATPTPTPSQSGDCGNNNNDGGVTINFYFADMLRGL